ncbi:TPA: hypothetical protein N2638_004539 [Salmonella enterica]|nr:hypothetical protein [Salmonella enterica]
MATLNQAVNGELLKGTIVLSEIIRVTDFFMDDIGNRFTLQMTGDADIDGNDEYALHDYENGILGHIIESDMMDYTVDCAKNITKVRICGLWLLPYKHVPVKLQYATV